MKGNDKKEQWVVIADDFSGAAEMAGIAKRFGLQVSLTLETVRVTEADVLVICSNSRSKKRDEALQITEALLREVLTLKPSRIFKKTDSALRGYIIEEITLQLAIMNWDKALFIPANPTMGRVIRKGIYWVNNQPISNTAFANDPEFPVKHSHVETYFRNRLCVRRLEQGLVKGLVVGEVQSLDDIQQWMEQADEQTLFAGAADFFTSWLKKYYVEKQQQVSGLQWPHLYICGTAFQITKELIRNRHRRFNDVAYLSYDTTTTGIPEVQWHQMEQQLQRDQRLVLAFDDQALPVKADAVFLRAGMARVIKTVVARFNPKELFIEGGATAGAVLGALQIKEAKVEGEWEKGVVRLTAGALSITVKPGSYPLPEIIKQVYGL